MIDGKMIKVNESDLIYDEEDVARHKGGKFTGYSTKSEGSFAAVTAYVFGCECRLEYEVNNDTGFLVNFVARKFDGPPTGGLIRWNYLSNLQEESIIGISGARRAARKWDENGFQ